MFHLFIGIDPGRKGAMAVLDARGELLSLHDACSGAELGVLDIEPVLRDAVQQGPSLVVVERPLAYPGVPAQDQITLALACGAAAGVARSFGATVEFPTAAQWKRSMGLSKDKAQSKSLAASLFGSERIGKARHDKCEAALLARWGFIHHRNRKPTT